MCRSINENAVVWRSINENAHVNYAFKASRRPEIDSNLQQHHLSGGGGVVMFAKIDLPKVENPVRMLPGRTGGWGGETVLGGEKPG